MANHCYNHITISDISDVNREKLNTFFKKVLVNTQYGTGMTDWFLVAKQFPHRAEFTEIDLASEDAFYKDPKQDSYKMFGSKWFDCCWERDEDIISGDSAWGPIDLFIKMLSEEFKFDFEMVFEEGGCGVYGKCGSSEGNYWEESMEKWEYYYKEGDIWSELEYYIDEGILDHEDLSELEKLITDTEYKELCDLITTAEQEAIDNGDGPDSRDEWLFVKHKDLKK